MRQKARNTSRSAKASQPAKPAAATADPAAATAGFNIRWRSKQSSTMKGKKHVSGADEKAARRDFEAKYADAEIVEVTQ